MFNWLYRLTNTPQVNRNTTGVPVYGDAEDMLSRMEFDEVVTAILAGASKKAADDATIELGNVVGYRAIGLNPEISTINLRRSIEDRAQSFGLQPIHAVRDIHYFVVVSRTVQFTL